MNDDGPLNAPHVNDYRTTPWTSLWRNKLTADSALDMSEHLLLYAVVLWISSSSLFTDRLYTKYTMTYDTLSVTTSPKTD